MKPTKILLHAHQPPTKTQEFKINSYCTVLYPIINELFMKRYIRDMYVAMYLKNGFHGSSLGALYRAMWCI